MSLSYSPAPAEMNSSAVSCDCLAHVLYGNAADHPDRERWYPSGMADAEWAAIRPLLPVPAWFQGPARDQRGGDPVVDGGRRPPGRAYPPDGGRGLRPGGRIAVPLRLHGHTRAAAFVHEGNRLTADAWMPCEVPASR
ncbi:hypothetical protein [Streptomyces sp. NPDC058613]|uniref:hypothetical protein n=1 Tax=unclassified Streptomyces TaxID=2593676 RepID=UPI003660B532